ncbi:MAG: hypothetical protein ABIL69_07695 [candidate division WOR-3 bacterium]
MDRGRLATLKAEIDNQMELIEEIYKKIEKRQANFKENDVGIESMAYQLHNLYSAYEELFEIVADYFENEIEGVKYHSDLLHRMKMEIEGIRPPLISKELCQLFDELRRFRHFFRHAYNIELNPEKIEDILNISLQIRSKFKNELEHFLKALSK